MATSTAATLSTPELLTYYISFGSEGHEDRVKTVIPTFSAGDTIEWLRWLKSFEKLINLKKWTDGAVLFQNARIILRDEALDAFNAASDGISETPDTFREVMNEVAREFIVSDTREYLIDKIKNTKKARNVTVAQHLAETRHLASLVCLIPEDDEPVPEKALRYYFRKSMPMDWQDKYDDSGKELVTLTELARYFSKLEKNAERRNKSNNETRLRNNGGGSKGNGGSQQKAKLNDNRKKKPASGKWCDHHRTSSHSNEECKFQKKNKTGAEINYCDLPDGELDELHAIMVTGSENAVCSEAVVRILGEGYSRFLIALIDTGSSYTLVSEKLLDAKTLRAVNGEAKRFRTPNGVLGSRGSVPLRLQLTEFGEKRMVEWQCHVVTELPYGIIIGRDMLQHLGFVLDFQAGTITWDGVSVAMRPANKDSNTRQCDTLAEITEARGSLIQRAEHRQSSILDADYKMEPLEPHLADELRPGEKKKLLEFLRGYQSTLFSGKLGTWRGEPYDIPTKSPLRPYHAKPYPIPQSQLAAVKKEIERLEGLGVIVKETQSPWGAPTFVIPKKDSTIRMLNDLRQLNTQLERRPWPLPKIQELLRNVPRYAFITVIDLNMGYYAIQLTHRSSLLTAFVLPFGKYRWLRLPMGISTAPDYFQARVDQLLGDLPCVRCYLDDVMIVTTTSFSDHLRDLQLVFDRLRDAGLTVNVKKCRFAVKEANFLGYRLTPEGIMPQAEKVAAIQRIKEPRNRRDLRHFLGMINYYRDVWPRRAHLVAPLAALTSNKVKWSWEPVHQDAFSKLKAMVLRQTLLHFPNYEQPFDIHTDASGFQLGGVISQSAGPLAFYSRKLTAAQQNYTVMELELLSIVETLKEFRSLLLGQRITIHTDHKNLACAQFKSSRVTRWRLLLEEFGPTINYVKGSDNIVADALSRLPQSWDQEDIAFLILEQDYYPLQYSRIAELQTLDQELQTAIAEYPHKFERKALGLSTVIVTRRQQMVIPALLRDAVLHFYHETLLHPGMTRTYETMNQAVFWPGMKRAVERLVKNCVPCQTLKRNSKRYGKLPTKVHEQQPWVEIAIDQIGPYKYSTNADAPKYYALTMIDTATHWIEIAPLTEKTALQTALRLDEYWLCRYPRPHRVIHDEGGEFTGREFQEMLESYGVQSVATTVENPQANGVLERVHQVIGNHVRATREDEKTWTELLPAVAFAIRATYHTTLRATPAQLLFGRDMMSALSFKTDWARIHARRAQQTARDNARENASRLHHVYGVGDQVLLLKKTRNLAKLAVPTVGPYTVTAVNTNGTIVVDRGGYQETINLRRLKPLFADATTN